MDDARTLLYEAVRDEILSSPSKPYAAIAYEYGITQVTVWKIAKTYGISRPCGRKTKNHQPTTGE
jgi:DNA invertase Pin-like site-specific DNA recombinase